MTGPILGAGYTEKKIRQSRSLTSWILLPEGEMENNEEKKQINNITSDRSKWHEEKIRQSNSKDSDDKGRM